MSKSYLNPDGLQEKHPSISSTQEVLQTPLSLTSHPTNHLKPWFKSFVKSPCQLSQKLPLRDYRGLICSVYHYIRDLGSPEIVLFFKRVLDKLLGKETNLLGIISNTVFIKTLLACCVETVYFIFDITTISFEDLLQKFKLKPLDFWKQINNFARFDANVPEPVLQYLKELENKILACHVWKDTSYILKCINTPTFDLFSRRLLALIAQRTVIICKALGLGLGTQEKVWESTKHFLSEFFEALQDKTVDQLLICMVYAVCEISNEATFEGIVRGYYEVFHCERHEVEELRGFYQDAIAAQMKDVLMGTALQSSPRIAKLNPKSPLRIGNPGNAHSPYLTPRTRRLWDFGTSSRKANRKIMFDEYETPKNNKVSKHAK